MLARVSCTAAQNNRAVRGILAKSMAVVTVEPNSGSPEDNSKTQPTAAIAVIQEINKKTPLFGVTTASLSKVKFGDKTPRETV
jgi:hypothetical protein